MSKETIMVYFRFPLLKCTAALEVYAEDYNATDIKHRIETQMGAEAIYINKETYEKLREYK